MSYFNYPRIIFDGTFQADPSTLNNTPNNYNPKNQVPEHPHALSPQKRNELFNNQKQNNVELYWNPAGTGNFQLNGTITKVIYGPDDSPDDDPWIGKSIDSVFTVTPPKLVDLDPMQMNVSEVWAMTLGLGDDTGNFTGHFMPIGFVESWIQAQAVKPSSASASAVYQSLLIGLNNTNLSDELKKSRLVQALDIPNQALSINFNVRAYNVNPVIYQWNEDIIAQLSSHIPKQVIIALEPLLLFQMNTGKPQGQIPTLSYFDQQLKHLLYPSDYDLYHQLIMDTCKMDYTPASPYDFTYGQAFGNIGPLTDAPADAPDFFTAARMLQPVDADNTYPTNFAPCQLLSEQKQLAINLGNALPTLIPGGEFTELTPLYLCYFTANPSLNSCTLLKGPLSLTTLKEQGGVINISLDTEEINLINQYPIGLVQVDDKQAPTQIILNENHNGLFLRANQFVFRMNSGVAHLSRDGQDQPEVYGNEISIDFYARQFGQPLANAKLNIELLTEEEAFLYTNQTLGTGDTAGLVNLSIPQNALIFDSVTTTDPTGKASLTINAQNPGNPRAYIDGQVYFLRYRFADHDYQGHDDDLISIQVYQAQPDFGDLTWDGSIGEILSQYGKLYPVMQNFDLSRYDSVKLNSQKIRGVLLRHYNDALYMPVVRDLSQDRIHMITQWIDNGCPRDSHDLNTKIA
ncbi:hypothetical protein [uncultured Shewanella sp.]|uniref:hypothetical protein n=1 Tax=uncultured Shewanella sp. TaxID=173975 RepID=UPI00260AD813|nr:hypothetical protein [uncultured Shewanella sp.]